MSDRVQETLALRRELAYRNSLVTAPNQADNGDESRYSDKRGTYSKALQHDTTTGLVIPASYHTFKAALLSGNPSDFERIAIGSGGDKLNGPQGGLAFYLTGLDSTQYACPPAPSVASKEYAVELIELYWAALLRNVNFNDYATYATAAVSELNAADKLPYYAGPTDPATGKVTPDLLFRGPFPGETVGPYLSQLLLLGADFGALHVEQRYGIVADTYGPFMLTTPEYVAAQNAAQPPATLPLGATRLYLQNGRGLASYTYDDVLYQAYLIANQVLATRNHPGNPGNPYAASATQKPFATFGGPDVSALIGYVANEALRAVWWEKWYVHLRHRPEAGGNLVHLQKTGGIPSDPQNVPDPIVAASDAVAASASANSGSYYLPQAFEQGSPTHPAYPTGHGTVAGACITVLKFFWNGDAFIGQTASGGTPIANEANPAGTMLVPAPGNPVLTLNGELHKLATNISFGHGIHAGIHWRSDTVESIKLGERVALGILQDRAQCYNEKFSVTITLLDGTPYTISNR